MARILYVDCCPERVACVCSLLEKQGHAVAVVNCAERAMLHVHSGKCCDAVITHLYLPGIDGAELVRWLSGLEPPVSVVKVAFTCCGEKTPVGVGEELPRWLPADTFVEGLERAEDLVEAVEKLLEARG